MSFEGNIQVLCEKGHFYEGDVYNTDQYTCQICKANIVESKVIDCTNGYHRDLELSDFVKEVGIDSKGYKIYRKISEDEKNLFLKGYQLGQTSLKERVLETWNYIKVDVQVDKYIEIVDDIFHLFSDWLGFDNIYPTNRVSKACERYLEQGTIANDIYDPTTKTKSFLGFYLTIQDSSFIAEEELVQFNQVDYNRILNCSYNLNLKERMLLNSIGNIEPWAKSISYRRLLLNLERASRSGRDFNDLRNCFTELLNEYEELNNENN